MLQFAHKPLGAASQIIEMCVAVPLPLGGRKKKELKQNLLRLFMCFAHTAVPISDSLPCRPCLEPVSDLRKCHISPFVLASRIISTTFSNITSLISDRLQHLIDYFLEISTNALFAMVSSKLPDDGCLVQVLPGGNMTYGARVKQRERVLCFFSSPFDLPVKQRLKGDPSCHARPDWPFFYLTFQKLCPYLSNH